YGVWTKAFGCARAINRQSLWGFYSQPLRLAVGRWVRSTAQVVSVAGPPGGSFAFWEGDGESDLGAITFSVPVGTTHATHYLVISENHGEPGADPYGHIHGREFTTSAAGTYIVGLR